MPHLILILWGVICAIPILLLLAAAFKSTAIFITIPDLFSLRGLTVDNFVRAWRGGDFIHYGTNSLLISLSAAVLVLLGCTPMAYGLNKLRAKTKSRIMFLILSMRFVPYVVLAVPMFLVFIQLGISGSRVGLLLAHLALQIPFLTWLLVAFFEALPHEIEEAALVDGCSPFRTFWNIAVPITLPGITSAAILSFITSWNEFIFALFLAGYHAQPLTVGITRFLGSADQAAEYGVLAAYGTLIVLPVLLFVFLVSRYIISGMTAGAVKG